MFQYIIQGWYALTIVLVASIVGYIAYYILEWFSMRRRNKSIARAGNIARNAESDTDAIVIEEVTVTSETDADNNEVITVTEETMIIAEDTDSDEEIIEAHPASEDENTEDADFTPIEVGSEAAPEEEENPALKKHRVKNIAGGVSREDILQDKHEKNLQKVKYEALLYKQRNDLAGYEKKLIEGLILDPDDIDIFRQLADLYFSEGKYTKAMSMFRKILTFDPEDHHALRQIGEIYIEQGQYEDAQVFVEKALGLSPDNPKYYISLIDIAIAKADMETALIYLEKIVVLRPRNISYLMALAEMYEKLGRQEDAKMTYFRVLEIDPLHTDVKHILKKF